MAKIKNVLPDKEALTMLLIYTRVSTDMDFYLNYGTNLYSHYLIQFACMSGHLLNVILHLSFQHYHELNHNGGAK